MKNLYNSFIKCTIVLAMVFSAQFISAQTSVDIVWTAGMYTSEVGFEIIDANGNKVECEATGFPVPSSSTISLNPGVYEVYGFDSWGDGWNGGELDVVAGGQNLGTYIMPTTGGFGTGFSNSCFSNSLSANAFSLGSFEILDCSITCPADIVVDNDPLECGAVVTVPAPSVTAGCSGTPIFNAPVSSGVVNFNFNGLGLINTPATIAGAGSTVADVTLYADVTGDFSWSTESFRLRAPDNSIIINEAGFMGDCSAGTLSADIDAATWNNWITTYGPDLTFTLLGDPDVDNLWYCTNGHNFELTVATASALLPFVNDYNNTVDATDYYPVGTTEVTFSTSGASCSFNITVNDTEAPTFDPCPADITVDLNPGECLEVINYEVDAFDNCGDATLSKNANLEWPTAVDFPFVCSNASADEITYFRIFNLANLGFNVNGSLESVDLGVWHMDAGSEMHIDVYVAPLGVPPSFNSLTLIGSTTFVAPTAYNAEIVNMPIGIDVPAGARVVIGARATGTSSSGASVGFDLAGENSHTWVYGCSATFPPLSNDLVNLNQYSARGLILQANFGAPAVTLEQTDNSNLTSGDEFPIGTTVQEWTATDLNGLSNTCTFNVTVNEYANPTSVMTCNNNVQISLPASGVAVVGADMILEGGLYGCYDDYVVSIEGGGNTVDCSNVGETLVVMVADDNSPNICWGEIVVEDKIDPIIECTDFVVDCNYDLSLLTEGTTLDRTSSNDSGAQPTFDNSAIAIEFDINAGPGATVNWVTTDIDISHTWVADLNVSIISPSGTSVTVFAGSCGTGDNVDAFFSDDNANPFACAIGSTPVISGDLQPQNPFAAFVGEDVNGTWTVNVADNFAFDPTNINNINLSVNYSATYQGPVVTEACDYNVTYDEYTTTDDCSGDVGTIERTYTVEDASGNTASCVQTITIARPSMNDLVLPTSYDDQDAASLDCSGASWDTNGNGYPDVDETGHPTLNGELFTNGGPCNFTASYEDLVIDLACESAFKVRRQWIVIDWCTGEEIVYNQHIKVLDTTGPAISCPGDLTIDVTSGNPFNPDYQFCTGNVVIPAIGVSGDDCSSVGESETQLWTADGTTLLDIINTNGGVFTDVEIVSNNPATNFNAQYIVKHIVYDNCGNASSCEYTITTVDKVAPTAICIELTTTTLNTSGVAVVPAEDFDNGSYDNCGDVYFYVARMPFAGYPLAALNFYEAAEFDCTDAGQSHMVVLLVLDFEPESFYFLTDADGNQYLGGYNLSSPVFAGSWNQCMVEISVEDKTNPYAICPADAAIDCDVYYTDFAPALDAADYSVLEVFGTATLGDNCTYTDTYDVSYNVNQCGEGEITREWTATDVSGNGPTSCTQTIAVNHVSDWDVSFPADFDQPVDADCNYEDLDFGNPTITNDECEMIAVSYTDQVFAAPGTDACFKVIREWEVINWCTYNALESQEIVATVPNYDYNVTGSDYITYKQTIHVKDNVAPTVSSSDFTTQVDVDGCYASVVTLDDITVDGGCSNDNYNISLNDGDLATYGSNGSYLNVPAGEYTVTYTVIDPCGNAATIVRLVVVEEKAPTAYCTDELVIDLMPTNGDGMAMVSAADFDFASTDNCTPDDQLTFAFDAANTTVELMFTCADLGDNTLEMYVFDAAGLYDFCIVTLNVQDNLNACGTTGSLTVAGAINTENADAVEGVNVEVNGGLFATDTDVDGMFAFDLVAGGDYTVAPSYDANITNGVTTFDIVKITQHILGIQSLDSAYKLIAADANNSASITTLDIVAIRKAILQIESTFPNNTSWRFVDAAEVLDYNNPWNFAEVVNINNLDVDVLTTDFVAVKIGDVTGDAATSFGTVQNRTMEGAFGINTTDINMTAGQTYDVTFTADAVAQGFQFTMNFDAEQVAFEGMTEGVAQANNFGFAKLNEGAITASWNAETAFDFAGSDVVTMSFTALADVKLSDVVSINSRFTAAEAYGANGELQDVELTFSGATANTNALYQNTPNPFKGTTMIGFELAQAGQATITIMDVNGKVVRTIVQDGVQGFNNVEVKNINATGVLYYTLESGDFTATKKMIIIE